MVPNVSSYLLRHATILGRSACVDIKVVDGSIASIKPSEKWVDGSGRGIDEGVPVVDLCGRFVLPPLVETHFHLDSVYSISETGPNESGTLLEGIALWKNYKQRLSADQIYRRAEAFCWNALGKGTQFIRSHVDVAGNHRAGVEALLALKETWQDRIQIELVAFPQDGFLRDSQAEKNLLWALDQGIDLIGGIPHHEVDAAAGAASIARIFAIAAERGIRVDLHCDETDDAGARNAEEAVKNAVGYEMGPRLTLSHLTALGSASAEYLDRFIPMLADSGASVVANPLINITLQGRADAYPKRRGMAPVKEFIAAGVPTAFGHDCVQDPWYAIGTGDLLDAAFMGLHVAQMTGPDELETAVRCVTDYAARVFGVPEKAYGLTPGRPASFVILEATNLPEVFSSGRKRVAVVRRGKPV